MFNIGDKVKVKSFVSVIGLRVGNYEYEIVDVTEQGLKIIDGSGFEMWYPKFYFEKVN